MEFSYSFGSTLSKYKELGGKIGWIIKCVIIYIWYCLWTSSLFQFLSFCTYLFNFCCYKITVILLSDLGGKMYKLGQRMEDNKDKLKHDDLGEFLKDFHNDNIIVYGYFKQYIEDEIDYIIPDEIILEILRFYNVKYSIEWDIDNSIDYGKKLLILNDGNTCRWSGDSQYDTALENNQKVTIAVSNHSISYSGEDTNYHLNKLIDIRFKVRNIINPGYPMISITFIDENDLKLIQSAPDQLDDLYSLGSFSSMHQRIDVIDQTESWWDIKKLKDLMMKEVPEDDIICLRFDFENDIAIYFKNDIEQERKSKLKINKNTKYKICASLCFQGDEVSFV